MNSEVTDKHLNKIRKVLLVISYIVIGPISFFAFLCLMFSGILDYGTSQKPLIEYLDLFLILSLPILVIIAIYKSKKSVLYFILPIIPLPFLFYVGKIETTKGIENNIKYCEQRIETYNKVISEGRKWTDVSIDSCISLLEQNK
jgi:hypothetical protein